MNAELVFRLDQSFRHEAVMTYMDGTAQTDLAVARMDVTKANLLAAILGNAYKLIHKLMGAGVIPTKDLRGQLDGVLVVADEAIDLLEKRDIEAQVRELEMLRKQTADWLDGFDLRKPSVKKLPR